MCKGHFIPRTFTIRSEQLLDLRHLVSDSVVSDSFFFVHKSQNASLTALKQNLDGQFKHHLTPHSLQFTDSNRRPLQPSSLPELTPLNCESWHSLKMDDEPQTTAGAAVAPEAGSRIVDGSSSTHATLGGSNTRSGTNDALEGTASPRPDQTSQPSIPNPPPTSEAVDSPNRPDDVTKSEAQPLAAPVPAAATEIQRPPPFVAPSSYLRPATRPPQGSTMNKQSTSAMDREQMLGLVRVAHFGRLVSEDQTDTCCRGAFASFSKSGQATMCYHCHAD